MYYGLIPNLTVCIESPLGVLMYDRHVSLDDLI